MSKKTKEAAAEAVATEERIEALRASVEKLDADQKAVLAKLETEEYKDFGYSAGAKIEVDSELFWGMINVFSFYEGMGERVNSLIGAINENLAKLKTDMASLGMNSKYMSVELLKKHVENIDAGLAVKGEVLDEEDAKVKIKESK